jgi:predicted permease
LDAHERRYRANPGACLNRGWKIEVNMFSEWLTTARLKLKALMKRPQLDRDLEEEMQFHFAKREAAIKAEGASADEARESAHRKFGNATSLKERCREMWMLGSIESLWRDLRYAARTFARTPAFTLVVVLLMALGIGANTALFSVLRAVLLRPLPFAHADRLVSLYERDVIGHSPYGVVSGGDFEDWQKQAKSFEQMSVIGEDGANLSGSGQRLPEYIGTQLCNYQFFPMLGIEPVVGRLFSADDDRPDAQATAVLTYGFWKRRFGGDPGIVGQTIRLDSKPYTVIGVLPPVFISETRTQVWLPVYHEIPPDQMHFRGNHRFYVWARLRAGVTARRAYTELDGIQRRIHREFSNDLTGSGSNVVPLQEDLVRDLKTSLYVLMGAVGCVLLIACLNVANLFVARTASRRKEIAIRASLGAGRSRLLREQIIASLALTGAGGALGVLLALGTLRWIVQARQNLPRADKIHIDATVLLFALAMTVLSGIFAGLFPALSAVGSVLESLKENSRSVGGGQSRARIRKVLLAAEVALTVVLLIGAGLLLKSFATLRAVDMGCATDNVLTMGVSLPENGYSKPAQVEQFFSQLLERVRAMPGVTAAGVVNVLPGEGHFVDNTFRIEERPPLPPGQSLDATFRSADPGYFQAMNIALLRGRYFTEAERLDHAKVAILSASMAREYFPNEDPIGKHLIIDFYDHPPLEIIGIVADVRSRVAQPPEPTMYIPLYRGLFPYGSLVVRSTKDVTALALPIQTEIARIDRDLAVSDVSTMDQIIGESTADAKFNAAFVLFFAALALVLAAVGLYGVLSYLVAQRTNEIGIRIALGAQRPAVMELMLVDGMRPAVLGMALGIIGGAASARLMRSELFGVQPLDATVFAAALVLVIAVAAGACIFPAWRASRLDPVIALRCD